MNFLSRIKSIINAKANAVLDDMENPEEALELSFVEIRQKINDVRKALVDVTTIKKELEAELVETKDKIKLAQEQAELALKANREDLAQAALEKKQNLISLEEKTSLEIEKLQEKIKVITGSKEQLEKRLNELGNRKKELVAIDKAADAQLAVKEIVTGISNDITDITDRIERAENKIAEKNARISAIDELVETGGLDGTESSDKAEMELRTMQRKSRVEEEMKALKLKMKQEVSD